MEQSIEDYVFQTNTSDIVKRIYDTLQENDPEKIGQLLRMIRSYSNPRMRSLEECRHLYLIYSILFLCKEETLIALFRTKNVLFLNLDGHIIYELMTETGVQSMQVKDLFPMDVNTREFQTRQQLIWEELSFLRNPRNWTWILDGDESWSPKFHRKPL
jgi:hypothetical protein